MVKFKEWPRTRTYDSIFRIAEAQARLNLSNEVTDYIATQAMDSIEEIIDGQEDEEGGKIESIPKKKAEDLIEIIKSGMQSIRNPLPPYRLNGMDHQFKHNQNPKTLK